MGFSKRTIKYMLHLFNLLTIIASLALIAISTLYLIDLNELTTELDENPRISYFFVITLGVVVFITAFIGCCGAIRESKTFLRLYACIMVLILIMQVAIGIFILLEIGAGDVLQSKIRRTVLNSIKHYDEQHNKDFLDHLQSNLECCGGDGPSDWRKVPPSCCKEPDCTEQNCFRVGCAITLVEYITVSGNEIGYIVLGLGLIEFVPSILALLLRGSIL